MFFSSSSSSSSTWDKHFSFAVFAVLTVSPSVFVTEDMLEPVSNINSTYSRNPPTHQSFGLIALVRIHLQHLGVNPYTVRMKRMRGRRLADAFPQYNEELLIAYSESAPFYNAKDLWL